ncbi:hypothetical protein ULO1_28010 [Carboxydocella sp. ULO1]|nr:hypothetical protein ULO1_28010 [Carboxydocella sp. ULO1]
MKHPVRLIETTDTEGNQITIVTNVFEKSAEEIGQLYRSLADRNFLQVAQATPARQTFIWS